MSVLAAAEASIVYAESKREHVMDLHTGGTYANSSLKTFLLDKNILKSICKVLNLCYKDKHIKISNNDNYHLLNTYLYKK